MVPAHTCLNPGEENDNDAANNEDPGAESREEEYPHTCTLRDHQGEKSLQGDEFFSTSYLAYGVDQFRERLWSTLIDDRYAAEMDESCDSKIIEYPCGFKGHQSNWEEYTLVGTGDAEECVRQVKRLLPHPEDATDDHHDDAGRVVGGIEHPTVTGKFFAMSLYFFTLDSLRVLSNPKTDPHAALNSAWPRRS